MDSQNAFSYMMFLQLQESERIELINQMHEETKLPQVIIEKDLWVTVVLRALFALPYANSLSFKGGTSLSVTTTDPENVFVEYKSVFNASPYIKNTIVLEIGGRSMKEPIQKVEIQSFIDKHFPQATFTDKSFEINVVAPERTFLEKVCLLHEEFSKPTEQVRVERMSRHIYDLARMADTPIAKNALKNKELFQSIVKHRRMFIAMKGFDYDTLSSKTMRIIPPDSVIAKWEDDYNKMQTMIYGKTVSFSEIINKITKLNTEIKQLGW